MFYREEIYIFLPDMSSLSHDSSIGLLEFLGLPLGSLWEHVSDIWVSIGAPLEPFGYPWGVYWIPLGTLWIPLDTLWTPLRSLGRSSASPWALFWRLWYHFRAL